MKQIVYLSSAVELLSDDELCKILTRYKQRNIEHHVTGLLLYAKGAFIEVIEGDEQNVDLTYKLNKQDSLHNNLIKISEELITKKTFTDWCMGFEVNDKEKIKNLDGYLTSTDYILNNNDDDSAALAMLKTFIVTHQPARG